MIAKVVFKPRVRVRSAPRADAQICRTLKYGSYIHGTVCLEVSGLGGLWPWLEIGSSEFVMIRHPVLGSLLTLSKTCPELSEDCYHQIAHGLMDHLRPYVLACLAMTCHCCHKALSKQLAKLRIHHNSAAALCAKLSYLCSDIKTQASLIYRNNTLSESDFTHFVALLCGSSGWECQQLFLHGKRIGDSGLQALAQAIVDGALPFLKTVYIDEQFRDQFTCTSVRAIHQAFQSRQPHIYHNL
mmetsp:Transcript_62353/g.103710  ORF Transcript_62353/g.103710 Transcript_62353/m.103710 type:complete len:242 (-) Transcript_62353:103-828(-)